MLLAMDGFDHYSYLDSQKKGWGLPFTTAMSPGRFSQGQGASWSPFSSPANNRYPLAQPSTATVFGGLAFQFLTSGSEVPFLYLMDGGVVQVSLTFEGNTGKMRARLGEGITGTVICASADLMLPAAAWQYIDYAIRIDNSVGYVHLNVNSVADVAVATGQDTQNSSLARITHVALPGTNATGGNIAFRYDDMYVLDDSGTYDNAALGDMRIYTRFPNADGFHTDFTPSSPGSHFSRINETILANSSFVTDGTVGHADTYKFPALATTIVVKGVQLNLAVAKDEAAGRSFASIIRVGTADTVGPTVPLTASIQVVKTLAALNPATNAEWAVADLNAAEFGQKIIS